MATHKPFRELVKPGSNFEFVGRTRVWAAVSVLLILGSIGMLFVNNAVRGSYLNWTIDFKGGTEIIFGFRDAETKAPVDVEAATIRQTLDQAGFEGIEISDYTLEEETPDGELRTVNGMLVRTSVFGALDEGEEGGLMDAFRERFSDRELMSVQWSGDRLIARSRAVITEAEGREFLAGLGKDMKAWEDEQAVRYATLDEAIGGYEMEFAVWGLERQFETELEKVLEGVDVDLIQSYAVGARAGAELREDGIKSLFYAMALIMLYLAFRFDIRYAPGAVIALLHDAILVVGVFAATWTEVSLTGVAALLTVIGYSVNDTVVIFDRIRENVDRLKDKKLARVINISLNETMSRTLLTSLTLFVVTLMMNIFGTGEVRNFAFAMNVGVIVGVYSSIFIASPVLLYLDTKYYGGRAVARRGQRSSGQKKSSDKKSSDKQSPDKKSSDKSSK
ncbi:protein translocase subunit SecF [Haliangium sp.]|uniref:protein translocase subunit SecF n=1 Tax=Haliangium sp. TaxID=2663208 RepID=UPI003D0CA114